MQLERRDGGYRVRYAIADVAEFVERGGAIEREAWARGETVYCPDLRIPLYPQVLSENAASLLPGVDRPAVVFTIDLDETGEQTAVSVQRAMVRSRHQFDYAGLSGEHAALLQQIGELRQALEIARGGLQLQVPEQTIVHDPAESRRLPAPAGAAGAQRGLERPDLTAGRDRRGRHHGVPPRRAAADDGGRRRLPAGGVSAGRRSAAGAVAGGYVVPRLRPLTRSGQAT